MKLSIVTRASQLALSQVEWVKNKLNNFYPDLEFNVIPLVTSGDQFLSAPLYKIGGKALFVKELDDALLSGKADIAIHSAKDIPQLIPNGLVLSTLCERESAHDAWIQPEGIAFDALKSGAIVGTSSLRRQIQLTHLRPDLQFVPLRGNVPTRIQKCEAGEMDGIVLAEAGLNRLGLAQKITHPFSANDLLPAVGQGAIGIVVRSDHQAILDLLAPLNHLDTYQCVMAERAMNQTLQGSCQVPIAGYAILNPENNEQITMIGRVGHPLRNHCLETKVSGARTDFIKIGQTVAAGLIAQGAKEWLNNP